MYINIYIYMALMYGVDAVRGCSGSFGMTCPFSTSRKSGNLNHNKHYN